MGLGTSRADAGRDYFSGDPHSGRNRDRGSCRRGGAGQAILAPAGGEIPIAAGELTRHSPQLLRAKAVDGRGELRIYYTHVNGTEYMTRSEAIASADGLLCKNFKRVKSDGKGRTFTH